MNKLNQVSFGLKNYYSDIKMLGKHFTVESYMEAGATPFKIPEGMVLRRHYTIANCMRKPFYNEIVRCLKFENSLNTINNL